MISDSKLRFTDRVRDYIRYRPGYPEDAIEYIIQQTGIDADSVIADIGAGTGLLTELLLNSRSKVVAVEPNDAMRMAADDRLASHQNYRSIAGSAEATGLQDNSVDLITAAQAFHWFDFKQTKIEFMRILKRGGQIALVWNRRDSSLSGFLQQYEILLKQLPEYGKVNHTNASDELIGEFLGADMKMTSFPNHQHFTLEGLKGRLMSSSYCPPVGVEGHDELMTDLEQLYTQHATESGVRFDYRTQIYLSSGTVR